MEVLAGAAHVVAAARVVGVDGVGRPRGARAPLFHDDLGDGAQSSRARPSRPRAHIRTPRTCAGARYAPGLPRGVGGAARRRLPMWAARLSMRSSLAHPRYVLRRALIWLRFAAQARRGDDSSRAASAARPCRYR